MFFYKLFIIIKLDTFMFKELQLQKLLHNTISKKKLKTEMMQNNENRITISFYKYCKITNAIKFRNDLYTKFQKIRIFGRIYIAQEGINAQISVPKHNINIMKKIIYSCHPSLKNVFMNNAIDDNGKSFWVLKITVKERILSDSFQRIKFDYTKVGKYLKAETVNKMIENKQVILVDMRNDYEYEIGHFENALQIPTKNFRNQLQTLLKILKNKKNEKIILYCTGGIRCEKSSFLMKYNGFKYIYQIKGGILEYIKRSRKKNLPIYFKGKIFVFDNRMSERVTDTIISKCHKCECYCDRYINCKNDKCHLLLIQCFNCRDILQGFCSVNCRKCS